MVGTTTANVPDRHLAGLLLVLAGPPELPELPAPPGPGLVLLLPVPLLLPLVPPAEPEPPTLLGDVARADPVVALLEAVPVGATGPDPAGCCVEEHPLTKASAAIAPTAIVARFGVCGSTPMAELPLADCGTGCPSLDAAAADSVPRAAALSADERGAASPVVGERRTLHCAS
jgi:hypothetical protein